MIINLFAETDNPFLGRLFEYSYDDVIHVVLLNGGEDLPQRSVQGNFARVEWNGQSTS